jgi:sarcosine oxidase
MSQRYDVIVIGLGAMGSAACYHLAGRGARVLGLEKFDIPHANGSSHGFSRMIRLAYREHPDYVPLVKSAFALWQDLEADSGQKLMHVTGGLYMGPVDGVYVGGALGSAEKYGLPFELLDRSALGRRYPQFHVPDNFVGMLEKNAGFIVPERAVAVHAGQALRRGAELHGQEPVLRWSADESGVEVVTERGSYHAAQLIFCGGAWTDQLVRDLGVPLRVSRQVLGWVWPKKPEEFELGRVPAWAMDNLDGSSHYGFPMIPESPGFKLAHNGTGPTTDPNLVGRLPMPGDEATFRGVLQTRMPDADGPLLSLRICLYTNTPDRFFIIDRHPRHSRVVLAGGFSGHGFKFATVVGQVLADLSTRGKTEHNIGFLGLSRFNRS